MKTQRVILAYLAGIIDADGTIGIKKSTYAMRVRGDAGQPIYSERVCVRQVDSDAIDLLHEHFGGYRGINDPSAKRGKPQHAWQVTDLRAVALLRAIRPFLRIKRAMADNCLALRDVKERSKRARVAKGRGHAGSAKRPTTLSDEMERLYLRAKELNQVGV